jgi:hypothetical protein
MLEMMADLTAYHATGAVVSPEPGIPPCLQSAFRKIEPGLAYARPAEFFMAEHDARSYDACCLSLERGHAHTARSQAFCREHLEGGTTPAPARAELARFDLGAYRKLDIDGHRAGLPLNSFLLDLEAQAGLDAVPRLLEAMREVSAVSPFSFTCQVPALRALLGSARVSQLSLSQVFERFRAALPEAARATYDRLWREHDMAVAQAIADEDARHQAAGTAAGEGADAYNALTTARPGHSPDARVLASRCFKRYPPDVATREEPGSLDDEVPGCSWACRRDPAPAH